MTWKDFLGDLSGWKPKAEDLLKKLGNCLASNHALESNITVLENDLKEMEETNGEFINELNKAHLRIQEMVKIGYQKIHPKQVYWDNKYPKANVRYVGRPSLVYPGQNQMLDVKLMLTPQDYEIHDYIINRNLVVQNPMEINKIAAKIYYKHQRDKFKYAFDEPNVGYEEYWMYPYELKEKKQGDCDDYMVSLASHLIAAGVPSWRIRCVAGRTNNPRIGHATLYVLDDSLEIWRHLNSTSINHFDSLEDAPKWGDKSDGIGIDPKDVWFTFNDKFAWHKFETAASKKSFDKNKMGDKFVIEPVF